MMRALYSAASGMKAQQMNVDNISNNIANVNTAGFKKGRADFQDLLYEYIELAGTQSQEGNEIPVGIQLGHGVNVGSISKIFTQGTLQSTGKSTDMAIEGDGFFQIQLPSGETAYTRAGNFSIDSTGKMLTSDGYSLLPEISVPATINQQTDLSISPDGTVAYRDNESGESVNIGQINLASFINPAGLEAVGNNLFLETPSSGEARTGTPGQEGLGEIRQRSLEYSNVQIVDEMVNLIIAQRAYEVNAKSIQASDDMLNTANNVKR